MNDHAYFDLVLRNHYAQQGPQSTHERAWRALAHARIRTLRLPALPAIRLPRLRTTPARSETCVTC